MTQKRLLLGACLLYFVSAAASYAYFSSQAVTSTTNQVTTGNDGSLVIDPAAPRTEACPLNGILYTVKEREIWEKRRPLAVMVENSPDARPHSGLNRSDIVYEAVAEGGVTRFMPIYLCDAARSDVVVAPVRSVRTYFIDWVSEYGATPLFAHVGGANCSADKLPSGHFGPCKTDKRAQAIEQLGQYGWRYAKGNDLDQFSIGAPTYIRNETRTGKPVATEHSVEARLNRLYQVGADRGWTNLDPKGVDWTENFVPFKFKTEATVDQRGTVATISHDFWSGYKQFDARWDYDAAANLYKRSTGGEPHLDLDTGEPLTAKNVVIIVTKELSSIDELKHSLYATAGQGEALVFQDGQAIEAKWSKKDRLSRMVITTKKGEPVAFNPGRIWLAVVGLNTPVAY
ncbi:hypothetical protein A2W24_03315 [Microgenomates group bacterium RBG_16_45_19]|nr:MAG: hypothetical protein A2W24_03315 [Microgenomates group bacterium RBG_16_45_19]